MPSARTSIFVLPIVAATAAMLSGAGAAEPKSTGVFSRTLNPGDKITLQQLEVRCGPDRADIAVIIDRDGPDELRGRGALNAAYADCRLASGVSIRIKAGYEDAPMPYGKCGGDPPKQLSLWIDKHKIVSRLIYADICSEARVKSIVVTAREARRCDLAKSDVPDAADRGREYPDQEACGTVAADAASPPDESEFPANPRDEVNVDELTVEAPPTMRALCTRLIDPEDHSRVAVPSEVPRPTWTDIKTEIKPPPDLDKLDFNATTFVSAGDTKAAEFDLENDGRITRVYQHERDTHWFDGSAFARDRRGILTIPFDAHDWDRSVKDGIYPFTYAHAKVFLHKGRTLILLDPANPVLDAAVVMLHKHKAETVCTFKRKQENF